MPNMTIEAALEAIGRHRTEEVVIATMTSGLLWPSYSRSQRDFVHTAPMGGAAAIGLGVALGRTELRVLVIDGDGSLRMNLGVLVTVGHEAPTNLVHFVVENGVHCLTGGQPLSGGARLDMLMNMAHAAGYRSVHAFDDATQLEAQIGNILQCQGPAFVSLRVQQEKNLGKIFAASLLPVAQSRQSRQGWQNLRAALSSTD